MYPLRIARERGRTAVPWVGRSTMTVLHGFAQAEHAVTRVHAVRGRRH